MSTQATLESTFTGELIGSDHPRYDEARGLFNGRIDKRPALIARCADPKDVQSALAHARDQDLIVAVRGGGQSTAGYSCCDDGVVVDTGPMKSVEIDTERRVGRFGAGLTWGELDAATQAHGLAVTGGRVTHTGARRSAKLTIVDLPRRPPPPIRCALSRPRCSGTTLLLWTTSDSGRETTSPYESPEMSPRSSATPPVLALDDWEGRVVRTQTHRRCAALGTDRVGTLGDQAPIVAATQLLDRPTRKCV